MSSFCLAFCVTQRGRRAPRHDPDGPGGRWAPTTFSRLARSDLEALVASHLDGDDVRTTDAPRDAPPNGTEAGTRAARRGLGRLRVL